MSARVVAKGRSAAAAQQAGSGPSRDFRTLVGFADERKAWARLVERGSLPQVLLITAREGSGKRLALAALAALADCSAGNACGRCASCLAIIADTHPEVLWIDGEGDRLGVEEAEAAAAHLALSPQAGSRARIIVIPDAERLGVAAANSLLKLLEEPPPAARILLSSSRVRAMLPTVLSRCVRWRLSPPPLEAAVAWLSERLGEGGQPVPARAMLEAALVEAGRSPGLALRRLTMARASEMEPRYMLRELLTAPLPAAVLSSAERLAKATVSADGKAAATLAAATLDEWEIALNAVYREAWNDRNAEAGQRARLGWLSPKALSMRRSLLSQARGLIVRGKVPLNAQLTAEALGLSATTHMQR